ncbi:alpha/beta fold hydrolase [Antrihabitans stalactiti]|uniref:Alpha/beta fold hydrolase n=1 Tax=Antrihabitans stalactiti TaxID=2584121 RepID=A0A848KG20_9NOCA|nr:alpha/beta fold hydrolase [Antrihabitans stalactiti]NMN96706.1 alpha/beta fold hydrolase [Antrihabitans stalactiti]
MVEIAALPEDLLRSIKHDVNRSRLRAKNALKVIAGSGPPSGTSPKDTIWSFGDIQLWRYRSDRRTHRTPLLIVHSLVTRSYVFDLSPGNSFVEYMLDRGFDVYLVDWGTPDERAAHYDFGTYCGQFIPEIVRATVDASDDDEVVILGYCLGGLLSLLYAAANVGDPIRALAVMATPVNFRHMGVIGKMLHGGRVSPQSLLDHTGNVPSDAVRDSFRMMQPSVEITGYADLWQHLWNDEFVAGYQIMTRWGTDHIPLAGGLVIELARMIQSDEIANGRVVLGGREVTLRDICVPFLGIIAERDHLVPRAATEGVADMVGSEDSTELVLPAGHVGVFLGRSAQKKCLPAITEWIEKQMETR